MNPKITMKVNKKEVFLILQQTKHLDQNCNNHHTNRKNILILFIFITVVGA